MSYYYHQESDKQYSDKQGSDKSYMPVYAYPGGIQVDVKTLPSDTQYKWIDSIGGQPLNGPAFYGDVRPDGKKGHGGVLTVDKNNIHCVEYHGRQRYY